jgi:hypothetical protein
MGSMLTLDQILHQAHTLKRHAQMEKARITSIRRMIEAAMVIQLAWRRCVHCFQVTGFDLVIVLLVLVSSLSAQAESTGTKSASGTTRLVSLR